MNFFEHQDRARRKTAQLVGLYALAVLLIILAVYLVVALIFNTGGGDADSDTPAPPFWNPTLFVGVAGATSLLILAGTAYKIMALSGGGATVARMLGGRPLAPYTTDPHERRTLNVVEEMAIASGTPVPRVYLLPDEDGINAFAAGLNPADAVIGVTRGCVTRLTRDELQGVIAHEFSHIFNGDMRLNIRLIGVLNGILVIALVGYWILRTMLNTSGRVRSRGRKGGGNLPFLLLGLALMAIGYIGVFFARLIKSAVSRQREYLADASSVQFTRNPAGLAGALKKIGGLMEGSRILSPQAEAASHLFFANGMGASLVDLMATHPPLAERIRRIDPSFDGRFPRVAAEAVVEERETAAIRAGAPVAAPAAAGAAVFAARPETVVASVGAPQPEHLLYAGQVLATLPDEVLSALHDPQGAQAVIAALLLDPQPAVRERQLTYLGTHAAPTIQRRLAPLEPAVARVRSAGRLAVADMAIATLRALDRAAYREFRVWVVGMAAADANINLFEYAILRMMVRTLDPLHGLAAHPKVAHHSLAPVLAECAVVLSTLARYGSDAEGAAQRAFEQGARELGVEPPPAMAPREACSLEAVDKALDRLVTVAPLLKQRVVAACVACVAADGRVRGDEAELLRAVADSLDCPIPPFLPESAAA